MATGVSGRNGSGEPAQSRAHNVHIGNNRQYSSKTHFHMAGGLSNTRTPLRGLSPSCFSRRLRPGLSHATRRIPACIPWRARSTTPCLANTGSSSSSPEPAEPAAEPAAPCLEISVAEVEAQLKALGHWAPQVPRAPQTWVSAAKAKTPRRAVQKAMASAAPVATPAAAPGALRVSSQQLLAAEAKAPGFGLSPEEFISRLKELRCLMPGVSASRLLSLEDDVLQDLMSDTEAVAAKLMQASSRLAAGALDPGKKPAGSRRARAAGAALGTGRKAMFYDHPELLSGARWQDFLARLPVARLCGHTCDVAALAIAPDGRHAVSGSWDTTLRVWDLESHTCTATLQGHSSIVTSLAITPDGRRAVSGSTGCALLVWDLQSYSCVATLQGHTDSVTSLAITPDGRHAVSGSRDQTLRVWDLESYSCVGLLQGLRHLVGSLVINPYGGGHAAPGSDGTAARAWGLQALPSTAALQLQGLGGNRVAVTADGRQLISVDRGYGGNQSNLRTWDLQTLASTVALPRMPQNPPLPVAITPDGRHAVCGGGEALEVWDLHTRQCVGKVSTRRGHPGHVGALAISPDGRCAVSGGDEGAVCVWDLRAQLATSRAHAAAAKA